MFQDSNDQFLKSFEAAHDLLRNIDLINHSSTPILGSADGQNYIQYGKKQMNFDNIEEDILNEEPNESPDLNKRKLKITKKFSLLSACYMKARKLSGEDLDKKCKQKQISLEECAKSHQSVSSQQKEDSHLQKSNKSVKSKSLRKQIYESESSFMKKIRNLQVRLKNVNLNFKTLTIKYKQDNQKLVKEQMQYKNFLIENYPHIIDQLNKYIEDNKQQADSSFMDDSSSCESNKNNDEWMPIMSKVQQLKIDGSQIFEKMKHIYSKLAKKTQIDEQFSKQIKNKNLYEEGPQTKKRTLLRKYSIPAGFLREKKLSFQTTMVTELKQSQLYPIINSQENEKKCKNCNQVKTFIYKFNQSLKQVPVDGQ